MPAPVKAYSDPATLNRLSPKSFPFNSAKTLALPVVMASLQPSYPDYTLVIVAGLFGQTLPRSQVKNIPLPPMGRQMLLTYPPIYKERGGGAARPTTGQLWPRIQRNG